MREDQPVKGGRDQPTCGLGAVRFSGFEKARSGRPSWHLGPWGVRPRSLGSLWSRAVGVWTSESRFEISELIVGVLSESCGQCC